MNYNELSKQIYLVEVVDMNKQIGQMNQIEQLMIHSEDSCIDSNELGGNQHRSGPLFYNCSLNNALCYYTYSI